MDRIGLLAMAFVGPELHPQFAPVETSARPVVLDNNAKARMRALHRTIVETVMHRRVPYTNTLVNFAVGQFGCVTGLGGFEFSMPPPSPVLGRC